MLFYTTVESGAEAKHTTEKHCPSVPRRQLFSLLYGIFSRNCEGDQYHITIKTRVTGRVIWTADLLPWQKHDIHGRITRQWAHGRACETTSTPPTREQDTQGTKLLPMIPFCASVVILHLSEVAFPLCICLNLFVISLVSVCGHFDCLQFCIHLLSFDYPKRIVYSRFKWWPSHWDHGPVPIMPIL